MPACFLIEPIQCSLWVGKVTQGEVSRVPIVSIGFSNRDDRWYYESLVQQAAGYRIRFKIVEDSIIAQGDLVAELKICLQTGSDTFVSASLYYTLLVEIAGTEVIRYPLRAACYTYLVVMD